MFGFVVREGDRAFVGTSSFLSPTEAREQLRPSGVVRAVCVEVEVVDQGERGSRTLDLGESPGHRGRKPDPLYRIRKLLAKGAERLDGTGLDRMLLELRIGDPDADVTGAWCAKESVRDSYLTNDPADAELLLDKTIEGCRLDPVEEIRSLGRTLPWWRTEILNHHATGASNGPTEALNLLVKRAGHGFTSFANYRLRILLHAGGVDWSQIRPPAPPILNAHPH